jgi:F0F1-type ATP synthase membrane subunit b/b'
MDFLIYIGGIITGLLVALLIKLPTKEINGIIKERKKDIEMSFTKTQFIEPISDDEKFKKAKELKDLL